MGTFLEWMLESSLLVLLVLGIRKIFMGKIRYATIYALWIIVFLRFMVPVNFISTPVSIANLFETSLLAWDAVTEPEGNSISSMDSISGPQQADTIETIAGQGMQDGESSVYGNTADAVNGFTEAGSVLQEPGGRLSPVRWHSVLHYGRILVAMGLLVWFGFSNASLLYTIRADRKFYGQRGKIRIYTVSRLQTPCLYGFLQPAIYLPESLAAPESSCRASEEELEQMITHEYIHYCHRDHIWAVARMLAVSLHWFHPFVWIAAFCSKKDAELFCDETVIRQLGEENRFRYGRMLVRLAGNGHFGDFRYSMMLMSRRGREMEQRIRAISGKRTYSRWMFLPLAALLVAAVGVTCSSGISSLAGRDTASEAQASEQKPSVPEEQDAETDGRLSGCADSYEEAFARYIEVFTNAVNTGNTDELDQVLLPGSDVYEQQCAIVQNYHKRGIREEIITYSIPSATRRTADCIGIDSAEEIMVYYGDSTSKVVKQRYRYICEYTDQGWIITDMQEITG